MPAPYSDNLYSVVDDDDAHADVGRDVQADDADDALSPADGYFRGASSSGPDQPSHHSNVPAVPNVMVEDPTLRDQDASDAKAREAEEERRLLNTTQPSAAAAAAAAAPLPSSSSFSSQHHRRRGVEDDDDTPAHSSTPPAPVASSSSHIPTDAPPAYSPRSPASPTSPTGYQTFGGPAHPHTTGAMGVPEEQQALLPRGPESMGGGGGGGPPGSHNGSVWGRFKNRGSHLNLRVKIRKALGLLLVLVIIGIIISTIFIPTSSHSHNGWRKNPEPIDKEPISPPSPGPQPGSPLEWNNQKYCGSEATRGAKMGWSVNFDAAHNLTVVQLMEQDDPVRGKTPHVQGRVVVQPTDAPTGQMDIEVLYNFRGETMHAEWDDQAQVATIVVPRTIGWRDYDDNMRPCIQALVTIRVPRGAWLGRLEAQLTHFDIDLAQGLDLNIDQFGAYLITVAGDINTASRGGGGDDKLPYRLAARETWAQAVSGDIKGWFPLYDTLLLHTGSGDIAVDVTPKPAQDSDPKPASLDLSTLSGDLVVREPLDEELPARDYVVKARTMSGDIRSSLAVSSMASFESQSGDLDLKLLPMFDESSSSSGQELTTNTKSGDTKVDLLEPVWTKLAKREALDPPAEEHDDGPFIIIHPHSVDDDDDSDSEISESSADKRMIDALKSTHHSTSGSFKIHYPSAWAGTIEAETFTGDQTLRGKGLDVQNVGGRFPRIFKGRKKGGESACQMSSVSGDEDFLVGEEW